MLKNYFRIAYRNLWKYKGFSAIIITGLALGLTCSLLIFLWVQHERAIDSFHANDSQLFKVYAREYYDGKIDGNYDTPGPMAEEMKKVVPEVQYASSLLYINNTTTLKAGEKILKVAGNAAGADWFNMFSYPLLQGNANEVLSSLDGIVLSESLAIKLFGSAAAAMGKNILYDNRKNLTVSGVYADLKDNVSFRYDFLISWQAYQKESSFVSEWANSGPLTFVMLRKNADPVAVEKKIQHFRDRYSPGNPKVYRVEYGLQPFRDTYLHTSFKNGVISGGRIEYVRLFTLVAIFILVIACINFMNLTTARSMKRAKEIGVRKVIGAAHTSLIRQFLGESLLVTVIATATALLLVVLLLPVFNTITEKNIALPFNHLLFWMRLAGLTLLTGILAGSYPALLLSSLKPLQVLKGTYRPGSGTHLFRKGLVVFQFVLSIVLIIGTLVISKQVNYIQTRNLGYDRENLLLVTLDGGLEKNFNVFKQQALGMPGIQQVSLISDTPAFLDMNTSSVDWTGKDAGITASFSVPAAGYDFVKTMKLHLLGGRDFSLAYPTDINGCLLNEAAVKKIGYTDPVGKDITLWGTKKRILGVVKDFHYKSLHDKIAPMIIRLDTTAKDGYALVRTQPGQTVAALRSVETLCKQLNPAFPFSYRFTDDDYRNLYTSEMIVGKLSNIFAGLAIFIACLGLLGLTIFTAEQRTKELGIRKVLGASVASLFALLSSGFLVLILISLVIACPLAWYAMQQWLQDYEYRTTLSWWIFGAAGVIVMMIALLMISVQSLRAAMTNPVKSLRAE